MKNGRHFSGFTLLEVIIVIIIVSVLASLALPRFFRLLNHARTGKSNQGLGLSNDNCVEVWVRK